VREVVKATGLITTVAGTGTGGYNSDGIPATQAQLGSPYGVAVEDAGNLVIADTDNDRIREVLAATGLITTVAGPGTGGYNSDGIPATQAQLGSPYGVAVDDAGNLFIADTDNDRIREVLAATGLITTVAGSGTEGYNGDGIPAIQAQLNQPSGVAV